MCLIRSVNSFLPKSYILNKQNYVDVADFVGRADKGVKFEAA
jgi:hypothetical protein